MTDGSVIIKGHKLISIIDTEHMPGLHSYMFRVKNGVENYTWVSNKKEYTVQPCGEEVIGDYVYLLSGDKLKLYTINNTHGVVRQVCH